MDIDTQKLQAYGLSAADVVNAVGAQNIILPAGDVKMGHVDYQVETNSAPDSIAALNDLPIKTVNGATIYVHDIGNVRDGFPPQTNIVRVDGQRVSADDHPEDRQRLDAGHHLGRARAVAA